MFLISGRSVYIIFILSFFPSLLLPWTPLVNQRLINFYLFKEWKLTKWKVFYIVSLFSIWFWMLIHISLIFSSSSQDEHRFLRYVMIYSMGVYVNFLLSEILSGNHMNVLCCFGSICLKAFSLCSCDFFLHIVMNFLAFTLMCWECPSFFFTFERIFF